MSGWEDLPNAVVVELRRTTAELLRRVPLYADDMLDYIVERIPEAGRDDGLRGLTLLLHRPSVTGITEHFTREGKVSCAVAKG
ncbi:hypothetical protein R3Q06_30440 [Rhodococcus erythropolis]|uniref:hypothetical protein n=1 Tax=Rhodococcus erythropolis TaxID=1833 RepID=UPI0029493CE1|nr:hypothetical protein [Rhodococcus erythropolis]MDV6277816.1 hypothetical protein [Rhodococcus erythropolis]